MSIVTQKENMYLIERCLNGERNAQRELYNKYKDVLFSISIKYAKTKEEAEDILVESFCKIFSKLDTYTGKGNFEGWIKHITKFTGINYAIKNSKFTKDCEDINNYSEIIEYKENFYDFSFEIIEYILNKLPILKQKIFQKIIIEEIPAKYVSKELGISLVMLNYELKNTISFIKEKYFEY